MKQRLTFTIILIFMSLVTACQPVASPGSEEPQDEPYPAPVQVEPADSGSGSSSDAGTGSSAEGGQPYPAPIVDSPVDLEPYRIITDHEFTPAAGDAGLNQGNIFIHSSNILMLESFPVQVKLQLSGELPTPCHDLRVVVSPPDESNQIQISVYSVSDPEVMCIQVLSPFDATIPIGDFTSGSYSVFINGESIGRIDLP